jgi:RNA polymerase sigma-70 factor (ECF subfamily)
MSTWWSAVPLRLVQSEPDDLNHPVTGRPHGSGDVAASPRLSPEDAALTERIRRGDRQAARELFEQYFALLFDHAHAILRSRAAAEDVVEDLFVAVLECADRFVPIHSIRAYLLWRTRHRALDVLRGERRAGQRHHRLALRGDPAVLPAPVALPDELVEAAEAGDVRARDVMDALATLGEPGRTIVLLRLRDELEYDEIALVVGLSRAAVKMQLSRSLRRLRARLEGV